MQHLRLAHQNTQCRASVKVNSHFFAKTILFCMSNSIHKGKSYGDQFKGEHAYLTWYKLKWIFNGLSRLIF